MLRKLTLLLAASVAAFSFAEKLVVKSVDNKDGVAKIQTEAKNRLVAVIQLDRSKKPVRSWTARTDADGRFTIPATDLPHKDVIEVVGFNMPELVAPNSLVSGEIFSFAMPNAVEGEVVDVKTLEGEVVASKKTDKLGRIFMPIGLAAGAYLITRAGSAKPSQLHVLTNDGQSTSNSQWVDGSLPMHFAGSAEAKNLVFSGSPSITVPVLASSQNDVVCAPPADYGISGGNQAVAMTDADGKLVSVTNVSMFNLQGVINRNKLMTGEAARLEFTLSPPDLKGEIMVGVLGGPVTLANGGQTLNLPMENGKASAVVQSIAGQTGSFQVGWMFKPEKKNGHGAQEEGPFRDGDGNLVTPQEKGEGYRRDHVTPPRGASWISEWWDVPRTRWWDAFRMQKVSKTDGKVETEETYIWKKGKKVSGKRTIKTKNENGTYSEKKETYNPDTESWSEDKS